MKPKNKLRTIDMEPIVIGDTYWSPYTFRTYKMTAEIFATGGTPEGILEDLKSHDGYFATVQDRGLEVWFTFPDGSWLDQTRLASLAYKERQIAATARYNGISVEECRAKFFQEGGVASPS